MEVKELRRDPIIDKKYPQYVLIGQNKYQRFGETIDQLCYVIVNKSAANDIPTAENRVIWEKSGITPRKFLASDFPEEVYYDFYTDPNYNQFISSLPPVFDNCGMICPRSIAVDDIPYHLCKDKNGNPFYAINDTTQIDATHTNTFRTDEILPFLQYRSDL